MSASLQDVQALADQLLDLMGVRVPAGQVVIHFADGGRVQQVETKVVYKPKPSRPCRKDGIFLDGRPI